MTTPETGSPAISPTPPTPAIAQDEDRDWIDRTVGYLKTHPVVAAPLIAIVVIAAVLGFRALNTNQPLGTDPTIAGHPLSNPDQHLHSMAVDPAHPGILYLGSHYGVFTSTNNGKSWPQPRGELNTLMIISLAASPTTGTVGLIGFAPSGGDFGQNGIYITHDGGAHWQRVADPPNLPANMQRYAIYAGATPREWFVIFTGAGVYATTDDGHTWRLLHAPSSNQEAQRAFWQDPADSQVMLLGSTIGLLRSGDGGATWQAINGIQGGVYVVAGAPSAPFTIYASADGGIYRSNDGGQTFALASGLVSEAPFSRMVISYQRPNVLYGMAGAEVWRSQDGGASWTQQITLQTSSPSAFAIAPDNDNHLYAGFYYPPVVVESLDGGVTWTVIAS